MINSYDAACLPPRVPALRASTACGGSHDLSCALSSFAWITPARPLGLPGGIAAPLSTSDNSAVIVSGFKVTVLAVKEKSLQPLRP